METNNKTIENCGNHNSLKIAVKSTDIREKCIEMHKCIKVCNVVKKECVEIILNKS